MTQQKPKKKAVRKARAKGGLKAGANSAKQAQAVPGKGQRGHVPPLQVRNDAAGIDIGSQEIAVAVPPGSDAEPVRTFQTFTADLNTLADWLQRCKVRTVAMESTGVYWIPLFQILEARGLEVFLVNAHHVKNVSGRPTDIGDCQWIQQLHSVGLLRESFRPPTRGLRVTEYRTAAAKLDGVVFAGHSTHAEGSGSDESASAPCNQRYYRGDRIADIGCDRRRGAGRVENGQAP